MATLGGSSGDHDQDMEGRHSLVEQSLPDLVDAYQHALCEGVLHPVVFLIDCEDPIGSQIARAWEGDDAVEAALLAHAEESADEAAGAALTTTLVRAFPFVDCQQEIPELFPYLRGSFVRPPQEGFLVVVISYGGAATFTAPAGGET